MSVRVRFAPSPTGALHIGGARTALFNYIFARQHNGQFILRIDDTDKERSLAEHEVGILEGLRWLGLNWDEGPDIGGAHEPYHQTKRLERHIAAADKLVARNCAYRDAEGATRLRYPTGKIVVDDLICGECVFEKEALGPEPVIVRSNGIPTYHLASVSDDVDMQISHVIRGADHLTNTAKQKVIFEGLEAPIPHFAHLPLLLGKDGGKLSKRNSEALVSLADFRTSGYLSEAIVNFLLLLGWSHPEAKEVLDIDEAISSFDLARVGRTGALFDTTKLTYLNGWWIRHLPVDDLANRMKPFTGSYMDQVSERGETYWISAVNALREGLGSLIETEELCRFLMENKLELSSEAQKDYADNASFKQFAHSWLELLGEFPPAPENDCYSEAEFQQLVQRIKKQLDVKGKELFHPLRIMVTGKVSGPELKVLVQFIRYQDLIERAKYICSALK